ncbi:MAG: hypothetical protein ACK5A2_09220, partial [Bacteroidota bacterium]
RRHPQHLWRLRLNRKVMTKGNAPINSIPDLNNHPSPWIGLTKREYFAAMAMQGLLSNPNTIFETHYAVIIADALIAELNK